MARSSNGLGQEAFNLQIVGSIPRRVTILVRCDNGSRLVWNTSGCKSLAGSNPVLTAIWKYVMKTIKDKNYSFNHTNERLKERFGIKPISRKAFDALSDKFQSDKKNLILEENDDQELHQILFEGKLVTFVFSKYRGYITTAFGPIV